MSVPHIPSPARPNTALTVIKVICGVFSLLNIFTLPPLGALYAVLTASGSSSDGSVVIMVIMVTAGFVGGAFWAIPYFIMDYMTKKYRVVRVTPAKKLFGILALVSLIGAPVLAALIYFTVLHGFALPLILVGLGFYGFVIFGVLWHLSGRSKITVLRAPNPDLVNV